MKPIAIFRHTRTEDPGYFATFLDRHSIPWQLICVDRGAPVPPSTEPFSGLCLMGGTISVNDPLPWIDEICRLIREAVTRNIPIIGHCFGGQLMSKALGGQVTRNPVKEVGWSRAKADLPSAETRRWLGDVLDDSGKATVFQWHGETFTLPQGATRILTNDYCANQMFSLGPHLGMQCHVEMTPEMIASWNSHWGDEASGLEPLPPSVQTPEQIQAETSERLPILHRLADQLYSVWIEGLARN